MAPPVPIPNTEVKRCSPDGSATIGRARVGRRQNKMPAGFYSAGILLLAAGGLAANITSADVTLHPVSRSEKELRGVKDLEKDPLRDYRQCG